MADQKLSQLTAATLPLAGTELVYVVQGGAERRTTAAAMAAALPDATTSTAGKLSAADKAKLDSITVDQATIVRRWVRNETGSTIAKGVPVYISVSNGTTPTIIPADASTEETAARTIGLTQAAINHQTYGWVIEVGRLEGINTSTLTEGQIIWLSETTGQMTSTRPTQPAHGVILGYCVKQGAGTSGIVDVKVDNGQELAELHDVLLTGAATDDVLALASDGLWKKRTLGGAAAFNVGTTSGTVAAGDAPATAITALKAEANPLPQYLLPNEVVAGTNMSVDTTTTPGSVILNATGGGGGTPGGTPGQMQYNNAGAFAGVAGSSVDPATGNTTFSARWIQSTNSASEAPATALTGTWFTGGTSTTTKPHFLIEPAGATSASWSTAGTGFGVNAPSGFAGDLAWFGVNGNHAFRLTHGSEIIGQNGLCKLGLTGGVGAYLSMVSGYQLSVDSAGIGLRLGGGAPSVYLVPDASNIFAQRNSTAAQTFRIYNTFTADANFERLSFRWTSNEAIIDTEAGSGGGTLRGLKIGSASTSLLGFYGATPVARGAAIPDATDLSSALTSLNALLARTRAEGRIAT